MKILGNYSITDPANVIGSVHSQCSSILSKSSAVEKAIINHEKIEPSGRLGTLKEGRTTVSWILQAS